MSIGIDFELLVSLPMYEIDTHNISDVEKLGSDPD